MKYNGVITSSPQIPATQNTTLANFIFFPLFTSLPITSLPSFFMHNPYIAHLKSGGPMSRLTGFLAVFFLSLASLLAQQPATHPTDNTITIAQRLGYPPTSRLLIIHADDFGMMHTVDTGTEEAFDNHWITSASILVPCPWFPEVAQSAKSHRGADLGIHLKSGLDQLSLVSRFSSAPRLQPPRSRRLSSPHHFLRRRSSQADFRSS